MREIRIPLNKFNLTGFIEEIFDFMRRNEIPSIITCFSQDGVREKLEIDSTGSYDSVVELLLQGRILFLPFSDINTGEPIPCADGNRYSLSDSDDFDEGVMISADLIESVGYLIQVEKGEAIICGSVFSGGEYRPLEESETDENLKEISEPMGSFVERFKYN